MKITAFAFVAMNLIVGASAWGHHNMSAIFDFNQRITQIGTLTEIDWRNPHVHFLVEVENDQEQVETWSFEGPAPGFFRGDDRRTDFENSLGQTVTVEASRARDGSPSGLLREITLADGTVVSACPQNC